MKPNAFVQNIVKITFLLFCLYVQINCQNLNEDNTHNKTFTKHYTTFNTEIKQKFSNITFKVNTIKYNIVLKMKYYEIRSKYTSISKTITLLQNLITENNWDQNNENKFNNEIQNFEKNYKRFKSLFTKFNKTCAYYDNLYKIIHDLLKLFFVALLIVIFIILAFVGIISFYVMRRQRKYYELKEEVSIHADLGKLSESSRAKQNANGKKDENMQIRNPKQHYGSSSKDEILVKTHNFSENFKKNDIEKNNNIV